MGIADNVKRYAERQGISIRSLERRADISNGSIQKWNDRSPNVYYVQRVAGLLDVSIYDLLRTEVVENEQEK